VAASIVKTFAGSLTTAIAGGIANKVMNAAENAKTAKKEREAEGLEKAEGGSLFTSALKTEFGGEIFNKALGRKEIKSDTPKPTNKPNQSPPSSGGKPSDFVRKAQEALNQDDDSVLVKDEQVRKFTARLLGAGIENKLNVINYSVSELSNEVKSLNTNLVHTQKLVYDQNELLGAKFDSILDIFSAQRDYQKEVVESGKVARREAELEQKQDLSTTQKIQEFTKSKKRGSSNLLTNIIGDLIKKFLKRRSKNIVGAVLGRKLKISRIIKGLFQGKGPFGKMSKKDRRALASQYEVGANLSGIVMKVSPEDKKVVLYKEELAGAANRTSANDEVKQYLTNQKTDSGEKLDLPQELLDIASQAEKEGVEDINVETEPEDKIEE